MHADYVPNPLYDNNPFIEALPPMLSGKDLIRALAVIPPYSDSDRDRSTGERLQLLSSLYEFYQPLCSVLGVLLLKMRKKFLLQIWMNNILMFSSHYILHCLNLKQWRMLQDIKVSVWHQEPISALLW